MTVFDNNSHGAFFATGDNLGSLERIPASDMILSALMATGLFNNLTLSSTEPASPDYGDLWLDTTTSPGQLKAYDGNSFGTANFDLVFNNNRFTAGTAPHLDPTIGDRWLDTDTLITVSYTHLTLPTILLV